MTLSPRAVVVNRRTEYEELLAAHGTRGQAEFFLGTRGLSLTGVEERHLRVRQALREVAGHLPVEWRRTSVERSELPSFLFTPEDIVVVVGQDGLVANVSKYLTGQPVVGVNPDPVSIPGVLVPWPAQALADVLREVTAGRGRRLSRTMVEAEVDDGRRLQALNEIYFGHRTHQSSRYLLTAPGPRREEQSSSGLIVGSGTGATGWLASLSRIQGQAPLPTPDAPQLAWFVREAWPSPGTGTTLTSGRLDAAVALEVEARTDLVCFGDGLESDALTVGYGQRVSFRIAGHRLHTVV